MRHEKDASALSVFYGNWHDQSTRNAVYAIIDWNCRQGDNKQDIKP